MGVRYWGFALMRAGSRIDTPTAASGGKRIARSASPAPRAHRARSSTLRPSPEPCPRIVRDVPGHRKKPRWVAPSNSPGLSEAEGFEGEVTAGTSLPGRAPRRRAHCDPSPSKQVGLNRFAVVLERFLLGLRPRLSPLVLRTDSRRLPLARAALTRYTWTMSLPAPQGVRHGSDPPEPQDIGPEKQSP